MCHPSLGDQDCILSTGVCFKHVFVPNCRITTVTRQSQILGPPLGLALYKSSELRKCVHANFFQEGFELRPPGPQAIMLPIEAALHVNKKS